MKPPSDVAPSELFTKLLEQPFPSEEIDFPRFGADGRPIAKVRIAVLPFKAHDEARKDAFRKLTDGPGKVAGSELGNVALREVYGDAVARELLARSVLSAKNVNEDPDGVPIYGRIFPDAEVIGERLSANEVATLFAAYQLVQYRYGPNFGHLTAEDIDAWVERLEQGANAFPLLEMPLPELVELTCSLAARVSSLSRTSAFQPSSSDNTSGFVPIDSSVDTGSSGEPVSERIDTGSGNKNSGDAALAAARTERPPLTLDQAREVVKRLKADS